MTVRVHNKRNKSCFGGRNLLLEGKKKSRVFCPFPYANSVYNILNTISGHRFTAKLKPIWLREREREGTTEKMIPALAYHFALSTLTQVKNARI